jgi:hypothetical protein
LPEFGIEFGYGAGLFAQQRVGVFYNLSYSHFYQEVAVIDCNSGAVTKLHGHFFNSVTVPYTPQGGTEKSAVPRISLAMFFLQRLRGGTIANVTFFYPEN